MTDEEVGLLINKANQIRKDLLKTIYLAQAGHPGGSLSAADLVTALYYCIMKVNPKDPKYPERDRFILSKGHSSALLYAVLADKNYFQKEELKKFRKLNSCLQGHPDMRKTLGVDMTTGSLGQGLSVGCGMALAARLKGWASRIYVMLGDGELNEGQVWEAFLFGAKHRLSNLCAIIDRNRLQLDGDTEDILPLEPLREKIKFFNWNVYEIDGHNMKQIVSTFEKIKKNRQKKPVCIIANTIKGQGVSYMENKLEWHGNAPNAKQFKMAIDQLGGDDFDW